MREQISRPLANIEKRGFADRLRLGWIADIEIVGLILKLGIKCFGHMDHLFKPTHCRPQILPLNINRGIVLEQFILARSKVGED